MRDVDYDDLLRRGPGDLPQSGRALRVGLGAGHGAEFEERGLFAVAPTTILGMTTRYSLGERGAINLIGLYQREQSAFTRPALGFEASANLIGGVNTELHFKPAWLTGLLNKLITSAIHRAVAARRERRGRLHQAGPQPLGAGLPGGVRGGGRSWPCPCARPSGSSAAGRSRPPGWRTSASAAGSTWTTRWPSPGRTWSRAPSRTRPLELPAAGHRHAHPAGRPGRRSRRPSCTSRCTPTPPAASCSATTPRAGRQPRARLPAALALDGHRAQPHRASTSPATSSSSSGCSSRPASRPTRPASGWWSTSAP